MIINFFIITSSFAMLLTMPSLFVPFWFLALNYSNYGLMAFPFFIKRVYRNKGLGESRNLGYFAAGFVFRGEDGSCGGTSMW